VVELLLKAGASQEIKDKWGRTASRVAWDQGETSTSRLLPLNQNQEEENRTVHQEFNSRQQQLIIQKEFMQKLRVKPIQSVEPVQVQHIYASPPQPVAKPITSTTKSLSKLVEYPGDIVMIQKWIDDPAIDPAGKDFYGIPALHKFASWDKVDLLELLLPKLSDSDVNSIGGEQGQLALHSCIELGAARALERLSKDPRVVPTGKDKKGRTIKAFATELGDQDMIALIESLWPNVFQ